MQNVLKGLIKKIPKFGIKILQNLQLQSKVKGELISFKNLLLIGTL